MQNDVFAEVLAFFAGAPLAMDLYLSLAEAILKAHPDTRVTVKKTQISFANRHLFACVSRPAGKKGVRSIIVSFGLLCRLDSPRVMAASQPYPNRWTHHVLVSDDSEIDGELMGWMSEAYAFSAIK